MKMAPSELRLLLEFQRTDSIGGAEGQHVFKEKGYRNHGLCPFHRVVCTYLKANIAWQRLS